MLSVCVGELCFNAMSSDLMTEIGMVVCVGDSGPSKSCLCCDNRDICLTSSSFSELTREGGRLPLK